MAHVQVTIGGRPYRLACGEGEEEHLMALARMIDGKIAELRGNFGEIGDQRITVMAALTVADELSETQRRVATLIHGALLAVEMGLAAGYPAIAFGVKRPLLMLAKRADERGTRGRPHLLCGAPEEHADRSRRQPQIVGNELVRVAHGGAGHRLPLPRGELGWFLEHVW